MRKLIFLCAGILIGMVAMANGPVEQLDRKTLKEMTVEQREDRVQLLESRIEELHALDIHSLDKDTRKGIKSELTAMEKEMKMHQNGYGIYISGGVLLIIIILLILL